MDGHLGNVVGHVVGLEGCPVFSVRTVKVPFKAIISDFPQLIAISTVLSNPGRPSTLTNDRSIYAHKNDGPSSPSQKRTKIIPKFNKNFSQRCGYPNDYGREDFEHSDFEESFKLPSRALNWQKSNISFLILNNLTFGFYFCGDNNPIVLKQLNSEFEVLRVGFATESRSLIGQLKIRFDWPRE